MNTTIAAIATPLFPGGLGVIRISGPEARAVADRVFIPASGPSLTEKPGYTAAYGRVFDDGDLLDEAVALVFAAPGSYTGEDVVEFSCHGGVYILRRVLAACLKNGAHPADPGEFTKRAFLNGKKDLTVAEAVMDLITAENEGALRAALTVHSGRLFDEITAVRDVLLAAQAVFSAWIDFPDDEIPELTAEDFDQRLAGAQKALDHLIADYDNGRMLREGVSAVLCGRPNTGKSTLMNRLSGVARSIVSDTAGTTRDVVTQRVSLAGIPFNLADTAGLRETADGVERLGVDSARREMETADLLLVVFDGSEPLTVEETAFIETLPFDRTIAVINKADLPQKISREFLNQRFSAATVLSASEGTGMDELLSEMERFARERLPSASQVTVANERQRAAVNEALSGIREARAALAEGISLDAVSVCIDGAAAPLLELTGERVTDAVVDQIFSRFCVGK